MPLEVSPDCQTACHGAARCMTHLIRSLLEDQGEAAIAFSGGTTPWPMLAEFLTQPLPWSRIHLFQVDERLVSMESPERNWFHLAPLLPSGLQVHPVPGRREAPEALARSYEAELIRVCGNPPRLDLIHLGLGQDGHTASLAPGHPVTRVEDRFVAAVGPFHGAPRVTLTRPALNGGRHRVWLACGPDKQDALARWLARDPSIPAGEVGGLGDAFFCDQAAVMTPPETPPDPEPVPPTLR